MVDSINRITSALDSARGITLEAAAVASSKFGETSYRQYSDNITPEQLRNLLNSRYTREVKDGIKRIIALMASGNSSIDVESYFADVIKNIVSDDYKVKTMVCVYLSRFAEREPGLALLPVNSIQKTINDTDPKIRNLAIKSLTDIKISTLYPIILHTLNKAVTDVSPLVRNQVCLGLMKLYREKSEEVEEDVIKLLKDLLADADPQVISSAILLFKECFPDKLELLHGHFRHYCEILYELDPWSQSYIIDIFIRYVKRYLPKPRVIDPTDEEGKRGIPLPDNFSEIEFPIYETMYHPDLELFLNSLRKLRFSRNEIVIVSCFNAYFQLTTAKDLRESGFIQAIVKVYISCTDVGIRLSILQAILSLSIIDSSFFSPYLRKFFISSSDSANVASLKMKVVATLVNYSNVKDIFDEMTYHISTSSKSDILVISSEVLTICGNLSESWESYIMKWLLAHMETNILPIIVLDSFIKIIRSLVQNNPKRHLRAIIKLSTILESQPTLVDSARAGIVWLFGELARIEYRVCPDVLRKLIPNFANEGKETRCQILLLSAKLLTYDIDSFREKNMVDMQYDFENSRIYKMYEVVVHLANFDDEYDIRDRARYISSIFETKKYEIASLLFQAPKQIKINYPSLFSGVMNVDISNVGSFPTNLNVTLIMQPWNDHIEEGNDVAREPTPLKDYRRFQKSLSSESYPVKKSVFDNDNIDMAPHYSSPSTAFTSSQGKKYRLQSLDEFFSDIPTKTSKPRRKIIIQEESSSEESETSDSNDRGEAEEESSSSQSSVLSG